MGKLFLQKKNIMTAFLIFIVSYTILDAIHDFCFANNITIKLLKSQYRIWHTIDAVIKLLVIAAIGHFSINPIIYDIKDIFYLSFIFASIRWVLHDLTYNLIAGKKWYYIGSGGIDIVLMHWQIFPKILFLFLSSFLIFQYY